MWIIISKWEREKIIHSHTYLQDYLKKKQQKIKFLFQILKLTSLSLYIDIDRINNNKCIIKIINNHA